MAKVCQKQSRAIGNSVDMMTETVFTRDMEATTTRKALILEDNEDIDTLESVDFVKVTTRQLREGMVIVDPELGCPAALLDHRIGALKGGCVEWLVHDLDNGRIYRTAFATTRIPTIAVAVR